MSFFHSGAGADLPPGFQLNSQNRSRRQSREAQQGYTGAACRIFIDNSRHDEAGWHPAIGTDSGALAEREEMDLVATVEAAEGGVMRAARLTNTYTHCNPVPGDRVKIKYLPGKEKMAVMVKGSFT